MKKDNKTLSIRISEELYRELEQIRQYEGEMSMSLLIRRMIKESLRNKKEKKEKNTVDTCQNKW